MNKINKQLEDVLWMVENQRKATQSLAEDQGLVFTDNQGKAHYLSPTMVREKDLSPETIQKIKDLHCLLGDFFEEVKKIDLGADKIKTRNLMDLIEDTEFELQEAWGFPKDARFHTHWLRIPGCSCAKMDNLDIAYRGRGKIINGGCPIHGDSKIGDDFDQGDSK